LREDKKSPVIC